MKTKEHTVCYRIFNYGFNVGVRVSASFATDAALAEYNQYSVLGTKGAKDALNEVVRTRVTLAVIVMYHMQYEPVYFYKYSEMLCAYTWIREHLNNWLNVVQHDYIRRLPPLDELMAMEEIAASIYDHLVGFYGADFETELNTRTPDRFDRLIGILGRKVSTNAPAKEVNYRPIVKPYAPILPKIMELRPNG